MSGIIENLREASFRGVPFLVRNSRITFSPGSIIHKYPNSKRVEVEYLGEMPQSFQLDMLIKGSGSDYFNRRNALKTALLDQSNGLLLHPYEGNIKCAVVGSPELSEEDRTLGVANFRVNFIRVNEKIYPTKASDNSGSIDRFRDLVERMNKKFIDAVFAVTQSESYTFANSLLNEMVTLYDGITDDITIIDSEITESKSKINAFSRNITKFINGSDSLSTGLTDLGNLLTDIGKTPSDQINLWHTAFDNVQENPVYEIMTQSRVENINSANTINNGIKILTLANIYNYTPKLTFSSTNEIDAYRDDLDERYESLAKIDDSTSISSVQGITDPDVAENMQLLRNETEKYLDTIKETVGDVVTIEHVAPTTLTQFVFSHYGELSQYENIKNLNDIHDPTNISGDIQIIL